MGLKGLTLYHLKSHLQKYRLGQLAKKQNAAEANKENSGDSSGQFGLHSSGPSTSSLSMNFMQGEVPTTEAVMSQIQVQKILQEQLQVQQKLQMRIEAQGSNNLSSPCFRFTSVKFNGLWREPGLQHRATNV
ncbi:myb family transcription factor PHL11 isoform X4 [Solanum lycopersicum]